MKTRTAIALLAGLLAGAQALFAQSTWTGGAGNWSSNGSPGWNGTGVPNSTDATGTTSAATGNITVNGAYTVGTLIHNVLSASYDIVASNPVSTNRLIFDVSAGRARIDLGNQRGNYSYVDWSVPMQFNDDVEFLRTATASYAGVAYIQPKGSLSGTGCIYVTNAVDAGAGTSSIILDLGSGNCFSNSFSGGIRPMAGCTVQLTRSGAAGSGTIDFSNIPKESGTSSFTLYNFGTEPQVHSNNLVLKLVTGVQANVPINSGPTVTLNGSISKALRGDGYDTTAARVRFNLAPGTLTLGGDNSGWTGELFIDAYDDGWGGTLIANHLQALPDSVNFSSNNGNKSGRPARIALLFNVAGSFGERIYFSGDGYGKATTNWPTLGTTTSLVGTVTLTNANAIAFRTLGQPLELYAGNAGGLLELVSSLSDGVSTGAVVKSGPGAVILAGAGNDWRGPTTVSNGTLFVNSAKGWGAGTNSLTVLAGGTLGGTGVVRTAIATVAAGGTLAPGLGSDAIGTLTVTNLVLAENAVLRVNGSQAASDLVRVLNSATLPAAMTVTVTRADSSVLRGSQKIVEAVNGTLSGTPAAWTVVAPTPGYFTTLTGDGKTVLLKGPAQGTTLLIL